jgi:hypothetical protein
MNCQENLQCPIRAENKYLKGYPFEALRQKKKGGGVFRCCKKWLL